MRTLCALLAVGLGLWLLKRQIVRLEKFIEHWSEGHYRQQIAVLKTDRPLDLPAIKPLQARKIWRLRETRKRA